MQAGLFWMLGGCFGPSGSPATGTATTVELGELLFEDKRLSANENQSCAACHGGAAGWTGPDEALNAAGAVYEGSVPGRYGNRKPTSSAYATLVPVLSYRAAEAEASPESQERAGFFGGNFWDGRATGWKLGSAAEDQAQGPFLNPAEQAMPDGAAVVAKVCDGPYASTFEAIWGPSACGDPNVGYNDVAVSIAAYEASPRMTAFTSRYDAALAGTTPLSAQEEAGRALFVGKAHCDTCHALTSEEGPSILTTSGYENIGLPRNPDNPTYATDPTFVDHGLGAILTQLASEDSWRQEPFVPKAMTALTAADLTRLAAENDGRQRIPTLRNVDLRPTTKFVKAYGHNGYFKSLEALVHFYNTRDTLPRCDTDLRDAEALAKKCWPAPEVTANVAPEVGSLGLSSDEESAIVAFLRTLSDQ